MGIHDDVAKRQKRQLVVLISHHLLPSYCQYGVKTLPFKGAPAQISTHMGGKWIDGPRPLENKGPALLVARNRRAWRLVDQQRFGITLDHGFVNNNLGNIRRRGNLIH